MANLDNAFGIHETALRLHTRRSELLASNLANADTPGYQARDIDFHAALREASGEVAGLRQTHGRHMGTQQTAGAAGGEPLYRNPTQSSIDGNTVDTQVEKGNYMENALRYQATLSFIDGRIKGIRKALRGS